MAKPNDNIDKKNDKLKRPTILKVTEKTTIMEFLQVKFQGKSKNNIKSLLKYKQIKVDEGIISKFDYPLEVGQLVTVNWNKEREVSKITDLTILYEDDSILVIDKSSGLLSVNTDKQYEKTAYNILKEHVKTEDPKHKIFVVHRLDQDTSGVMMFAKTAEVQQILQSTWKESVLERKYSVVVEGKVKDDEGVIQSWMRENNALVMYSSKTKTHDAKEAITNYKVIKRSKKYSLLEVQLDTGRKNQIRLHMKDLGHSIVGDKKYGASENPIKRLGLHAKLLVIKHPKTGKVMTWEVNIPRQFTRLF